MNDSFNTFMGIPVAGINSDSVSDEISLGLGFLPAKGAFVLVYPRCFTGSETVEKERFLPYGGLMGDKVFTGGVEKMNSARLSEFVKVDYWRQLEAKQIVFRHYLHHSIKVRRRLCQPVILLHV